MKMALGRLEPDARKRARPVLRGGGNGNIASLPDKRAHLITENGPTYADQHVAVVPL
jgi:hypothetical protein